MTEVTDTTEDPEVQELHGIIQAQCQTIATLTTQLAIERERSHRLGQNLDYLRRPPSQEPIGHIDDRGWLIPVRPIAAYKGHPNIPVYLHPPQAHSYGQAVQA